MDQVGERNDYEKSGDPQSREYIKDGSQFFIDENNNTHGKYKDPECGDEFSATPFIGQGSFSVHSVCAFTQ
jgi:hypothetical protein